MRPPLHALLRFLIPMLLILGSALAFTAVQLGAALDPGWRWSAWLLAALLWAFPVVRLLFYRGRPAGLLQTLALTLLGTAATLLMVLLALRLSGWGLHLAGLAWPRWAPWWGLGLAAFLMLWGWRSAMGPAQLSARSIPIKGLAPGLEGLRIVQISDLHVSHLIGAGAVQRLVDQVAALKPDLIAVTGDLVDGPRRDLAAAVAPLAALRAPLGVHYVTGNHEYFWGVDGWLEEFAGLGFELLTNGHRMLSHKGATLRVVGVNDPTAAHVGGTAAPDLGAALLGAGRADFTLFLAHQPLAWPLAVAADADLFLAGHTHGGQFFPFSLLIGLFHKYAQGLARHDEKLWVYVHRGSGFWGPPSRLGVPPEIALLELVGA